MFYPNESPCRVLETYTKFCNPKRWTWSRYKLLVAETNRDEEFGLETLEWLACDNGPDVLSIPMT